eukprot:3391858-Rhodomonas_salina.2
MQAGLSLLQNISDSIPYCPPSSVPLFPPPRVSHESGDAGLQSSESAQSGVSSHRPFHYPTPVPSKQASIRRSAWFFREEKTVVLQTRKDRVRDNAGHCSLIHAPTY